MISSERRLNPITDMAQIIQLGTLPQPDGDISDPGTGVSQENIKHIGIEYAAFRIRLVTSGQNQFNAFIRIHDFVRKRIAECGHDRFPCQVYFTSASVSRAMAISSLVGITSTLTLLSGAEISTSFPQI